MAPPSRALLFQAPPTIQQQRIFSSQCWLGLTSQTLLYKKRFFHHLSWQLSKPNMNTQQTLLWKHRMSNLWPQAQNWGQIWKRNKEHECSRENTNARWCHWSVWQRKRQSKEWTVFNVTDPWLWIRELKFLGSGLQGWKKTMRSDIRTGSRWRCSNSSHQNHSVNTILTLLPKPVFINQGAHI